MRCTPSHLTLPLLAVGLVVHSTLLLYLLLAATTPAPAEQALVNSSLLIQQQTQSSWPSKLASTPSKVAMSETLRTQVARLSSRLCIVLDASSWSLYKWRIVATVGIVALQSLLIVGLVFERRRKRMAARSLKESENRYRNVVETQTELICRFLPDSTLTFVNDAYCRYFGKNREELIGSKFVYLIPENDQEMTLRHINSLVENPPTELNEHQVIRPDGSIGWQQWENHVISRDGLVELQGIGRDITERKLAEEALSVSEEFNRRIVESSSDCVKVLDLDGNLVYMSEHGQKLLEVDDVESLIGTSWIDLWKGDDGQSAKDAIEKARNGDLGAFRGFGLTLKGTPKWWHTVISPMRGPSGNVERLLAVTRDVTNQELAVNALQESEQRFAKAFRGNPQPMSLTTLNGGTYIDVNASFLNMTGYLREEVIGKTSLELNVFETPDHRRALLVDPLTNSGANTNFEMRFRTKSGAFRVLLSSAELLEISGQKCILVASSDITERKALEENLRLSEREFSTLVENSPDIISRLDKNLRYIYVNPTLERLTGIPTEHIVGRTPREISSSNYASDGLEEGCNEAIKTKKSVQRASDYLGRKYWTRIIPELSDEGIVESVMTISEDVTDRLRAEQELVQLTVRLFTLQDEERRRIARELHDVTAQNLFAISVNLAKVSQLIPHEPGDAHQLIDECQSLGDQSLQEIRTLSYLLHPPLLDQAGLISALQWFVEGFTKRSGIYVNLYAQPIGRLPSEIEMTLFRVVQEALTNVRRHSASETASIRLEKKQSEILLEIKDQGRGLTKPRDEEDSNGLISMGVGIPGMRQRLRQLGGKLEIAFNDDGTTISAIVPLKNGANHVTHSSRGRS